MSFPDIPNTHAAIVMLLTVFALFLFSRERIPLQSSSLLVLVLITVLFEVYPFEEKDGEYLRGSDFFTGFGHEGLVAVCGLMIAGQALVRTGALEPVGHWLARIWRVKPTMSLLLTLLTAGALSAFVNNTPIVVLLLPILINVSLKTNTPASTTLMPMGFATIVGGMSTTIGTSTNLLVVSVAASMGATRLGMFDFAPPALIAGFFAVIYLWLVAPRMLPERQAPMTDTSPRIYVAQISIPEESYGDGKTLADVIDKTSGAMGVRRIRRGSMYLMPLPDVVLQAGDKLVVHDKPESLREYKQVLGGKLYSGDQPVDEDHPLKAEDQQSAEVVISPGSRLEGARLGDARLDTTYNLIVLAIHRAGVEFVSDLQDVVLQAGDVLLVQGSQEDLAQVRNRGELLVLDGSSELPHTKKAPIALGIMAGIVVTAAFGVMPIAVASMAGFVLLLATQCISWRHVGTALNAQIILLIVASLALGKALMRTGGADYLAEVLLFATSGMTPIYVVGAMMLFMALLTNVVSNNAAAVIGTPIAISVAQHLALPYEPFILAVLFGANLSFATPMAYQTNLLVMNAGGYRFNDFVRVGVPLIVMMLIILTVVLVRLYDL